MKRFIGLMVVTIALISLLGCDGLIPDPADRIEAFMSDINSVSPDYTAIQSTHFSPDMADYVSLATSTYWDGTFFNTSISGTLTLESTAAVALESTASLSTNITGTLAGTFPASFSLVLVGDNPFMSDWLISQIIVTDSGDPVPISVVR